MNSMLRIINLIRRYFQIYWLKPFDGINDAANAWALSQFEWSDPILEVGGGDGVFSFVMHGGEFLLRDDRYSQTNPSKLGDIYDVYHRDQQLNIKRDVRLKYQVGVDLKLSHLYKSAETNLYKALVLSKPESLPLASGSFKTVFLYIFHGLTDYRRSLLEIRRVIQLDGSLLMIAFNRSVTDHFVCYPLYQYCEGKGWNRLSDYFRRLDGGRFEEISGFSNSLNDWKRLLEETGFTLTEVYNQVSPLVWRLYDLQTRPLLKSLIRWNWLLERLHVKTMVKAIWVYTLLPALVLFYVLAARPSPHSNKRKPRGIFFAFRAVPCQK